MKINKINIKMIRQLKKYKPSILDLEFYLWKDKQAIQNDQRLFVVGECYDENKWVLSALGRPRGMGWGGRREGASGWVTHVNPWLIHVNVWQKPLQYCKVISLQ